MSIFEKINQMSEKAFSCIGSLETEEATKNALIMPFISNVLGYDVFNHLEVVPEFTLDVFDKKGEKVDYALMKDGDVQILIECKKASDELLIKHASQLYRYFSVSNARIAILTNGVKYLFFTDLESPNKMDDKPFMSLDLLSVDPNLIQEIEKLSKNSFDLNSIINSAEELKYLSEIKSVFSKQFVEPSEGFVKFFLSEVYSGTQTARIKNQFLSIIKKGMSQYINDKINERLNEALKKDGGAGISFSMTDKVPDVAQDKDVDSCGTGDKCQPRKIITTEDEMEAFNIIRAILRKDVSLSRVFYRDSQTYFSVMMDDNNRKTFVRLWFNSKQKQISIIDENKNEKKIPISSVDDIFCYADDIIASMKNHI